MGDVSNQHLAAVREVSCGRFAKLGRCGRVKLAREHQHRHIGLYRLIVTWRHVSAWPFHAGSKMRSYSIISHKCIFGFARNL